MSVVPITWSAVVQLVTVTLLPIIPLLLTLISLEELLKRIVKVLGSLRSGNRATLPGWRSTAAPGKSNH